MASSASDRAAPVVAPDDAGGGIIAWQELGTVRAQRINGSGGYAWDWAAAGGVEVAPGGPMGPYMQTAPRIASDGAGGAFVVWHDERHSGCRHLCYDEFKELYATRITKAGTIAEGWPATGLLVGSAMNYMGPYAGNGRGGPNDFNTVVAADGRGGVIVAWQEWIYPAASHPIPGIHAQRISGSGVLLWGPRGVVVCGTSSQARYPALLADGTGGAYVAWEDPREDSGVTRVYGQHLTAAGECLWGAGGQPITRDGVANERFPVLAGQAGAGFVVAWQAGGDGGAIQLLAQRVNRSGRVMWPVDAVLSGPPHPQDGLAAMFEAEGDVWFAWIDNRVAGENAVYSQRLTMRGTPAQGWNVNGNRVTWGAPAPRSRPMLVSAGSAGAYVTWLEGRCPRAMRVTSGGDIPDGWNTGGARLSTSSYGSDQIALVADGDQGALVAWEQGRPPDGNYEDVVVQRLVQDGVDGPQSSDRPGRRAARASNLDASPGFSLEGFVPNPSVHDLTVAFSLSEGAPSRIEMFDLGGRLCRSIDVTYLGPGRHVVRLGSAGREHPGVYLLRLTSGDRVLVKRGIVVR